MKSKTFGRFIGVLFIVSLATMAVGWYVPSVPLSVFYLGFCGLLLSGLLCLARWIGIPATGIIAVLGFLGITAGIIPIPIPILEKDYPKPANELVERSDVLKDKHPTYVPDMISKEQAPRSYHACYVNKSPCVIALDLGETTTKEKKLCGRLYPTFGKAMKAARGFDCDLLPSVELVDGYKKHLDDRILAALEEHLSAGSCIFPGGKQALLAALLEEVLKRNDPDRDKASSFLAAAIELGGGRADVPQTVRSRARSLVQSFLRDTARSEPIGFYSESEALRRVFRRDRFLAKAIEQDESIAPLVPIAEALSARPDLLRAYSDFRKLNERITNADVDLNLEDLLRHKALFGDAGALSTELFRPNAPEVVRARLNKGGRGPGIAFWPASTSPENRLFKRIYQTEELPSSNCMEDLIAALRAGSVSLDPTADSGYYDYQLYALETLVMPENAQEEQKLLLRARYKKRLREAFEAMLAKRRETHVKYLEIPGTAGGHSEPRIWTPELSVEPCATNYLRTARAYRYLAGVLRSEFGEEELDRIELAGLPGGLLRELDGATALFYGLYLVVCNDIGLPPGVEKNELESVKCAAPKRGDSQNCIIARLPGLSGQGQAARIALWEQARDWLRDIETEDFVKDDARVIVPVLTNMRRTQVRNWAVVGMRLLKIKAYYAVPPVVEEVSSYEPERVSPKELLEESYRQRLRVGWLEWRPKEYVIPVQVFAEVTLGPRPLSRAEFRAICDRCSTKEEVIKALKTASWSNSHPSALWVVPVLVGCLGGWAVWRRKRRR